MTAARSPYRHRHRPPDASILPYNKGPAGGPRAAVGGRTVRVVDVISTVGGWGSTSKEVGQR